MKTVSVEVSVTGDDIKNGIVSDAQNCAVHLAFRRVLKSGLYVQVGCGELYIREIETTDKRVCVHLPEEVSEFIWAVDAKESPDPITFKADVPVKYLAGVSP